MIMNYDPFGYDYMMYTIHNKCVEIPEMKYEDDLKFIYFYTKGKIGGNKEIKSLLNYLQQSIIDNVTDAATMSIHGCVEKIKQSAEVRGKYMTIGEIMDYEYEAGMEAGRKETLLNILNDLGEVTPELADQIRSLDADGIKIWTKLVARSNTMQEFLEKLTNK